MTDPTGARVVGEALGGTLGAIGGGIALGYAGSKFGPQGGEDPGLIGGLIGVLVGVPVGAGVGVHLAGRISRAPVKFGDALGGSLLGMGTLIVLGGVLRLDPDHGGFWIAFLGMPVGGAILMQEVGISRRVRLQVAPFQTGARVSLRIAF